MNFKKIISFLLLFSFCQILISKAIPVKLMRNDKGNWQLLRDEQPYFIKGAGGDGSKEFLAECGANSFRTWGVDEDLELQLDEAEKLGLSVVVGHWLGQERHGFDYNNSEMLKEQFNRVKSDVLKYKDHPAVLLWAIGNEMEGFAEGDNVAIWQHVEDLAKMIKEIDPHHPTMTVTAEIGGKRIEMLHKYCPSIDILGINSYGGLPTIPARYKKLGGTKPYIITEFGPPGNWESAETDFGAPLELNSTQKAKFYQKAYKKGVLNSDGFCLGSFAFFWGSKIEVTSSWYGMFLPTAEKLAAVDAMKELWSNQKTENLCPEIRSFELTGSDLRNIDEEIEVKLDVSDPEKDKLKIVWMICKEPEEYLIGEQTQWVPLALENIITSISKKGATLAIPSAGIYRLYMTAVDEQGGAAAANVPIKVIGEKTELNYKLPLAVYVDDLPQPWFHSGWMGNYEALTFNAKFTENTHLGKNCIKIRYSAPNDWVGVAWQYPANDWGNLPGGYNLAGVTKLTFWAKGEFGTEVVSFGVGLLDSDKKYFDTAKAELKDIKLKQKWKKYTIKLKNKDLSNIKTPFYFVITGQQKSVTFYLDDIKFE